MSFNDSTKSVEVQIPATYTTDPKVNSAGAAATWTKVATIAASAATPEAGKTVEAYCVEEYVTLARKQTNAATFDLTAVATVTFGEASALNKAFRVGMLINNVWYEGTDQNKGDSAGNLTATFDLGTVGSALADNTAYVACLVAWFEGEDSDCFSNNAVSLSTNTISWAFEATNHA